MFQVMRGPRILAEEGTYHLIARSNNGIYLCRNSRDYLALKKRVIEYMQKACIAIYHYAIMKNHIHLLAYVPKTEELPVTMQAFQLSYFHYYRKHYEYCGHLWQSRYRSITIDSEEQLIQCGRYIELNAIHAGVVKSLEDYVWSSYSFYALGKPDVLVTPNPLYISEGKELDRNEYRQFIAAGIDHKYQLLKNNLVKGY